MKRMALAISAVAVAVVALPAGTAAQAAAEGGYTVTQVSLASKVLGIAEDPATGLLYVGGYRKASGQGTITVINGSTHTVKAEITLPSVADIKAVDPATDKVYAITQGGLAVIDGHTGQATTIPITSLDGDVAVDPVTDTVYATVRRNDTLGVAVIDGANDSVTTTVMLGGTTGSASLAVDAATDTVYAAEWDGTLYAIDGARNQISRSTTLSPYGGISGLAFDTATGNLYVVDNMNNTVYVVGSAKLAPTTPITGCPYHIAAAAADPATNAVFVSSEGTASPSPADSTCVIDTTNNTIAGTFPRGGLPVAADPVTGVAYIAAWYPDTSIWVATPSATNEWSPMIWGFGPSVFGSPSTTFAVGVRSSRPLMVSAEPAATVTETGPLPTGITMSSTGVFSGTPAAGTAGTYPITVSASNGIGPASAVSLKITVDVAPTITSPATATFRTGAPGAFTVRAAGVPAPTVRAAGYPSWMTFTPGTASGTLTGTPPGDSGGVWPVIISASNGSGVTATQTLMVTVDQSPRLAAKSHLRFRAGRHVRYVIRSTGYPTPSLRERGRLPRGLRFRTGRNGTARIVGRAVRKDKGKRYRIVIIASNHVGRAARRHVTIRIR